MRKLPRKHKAQSYCIKNNILIYPVPSGKNVWMIAVERRGKKPVVSKERYSRKKLNEKIWELYEFFYDKRNV